MKNVVIAKLVFEVNRWLNLLLAPILVANLTLIKSIFDSDSGTGAGITQLISTIAFAFGLTVGTFYIGLVSGIVNAILFGLVAMAICIFIWKVFPACWKWATVSNGKKD